MIQDYLHKAGWFVGLLLLQVLILNNVHIAGYATPFLYIYLIVKMGSDTPRNALLLWAFFLGLGVDVYSDTPGMNAAATVLLAFVRPTLLRLFVPHDMAEQFVPGVHALGVATFLKYATACVLLHHTVLLCIEFFSTAHPFDLVLRVLSSVVLTLACILALEAMCWQRRTQ